MTVEQAIRNGVEYFNESQTDSSRHPLSRIEGNMLVQCVLTAVQKQVDELRTKLELAASQSDLKTQRELDWATDMIVAFIRMENQMSLDVRADEIQKFAAGFNLRVEHEDGIIKLELQKSGSS